MSDNERHSVRRPKARKPTVRKAKEALRDIGARQITDVLDGRTSAARELRAWRDALVSDMGGIESVSAQQLTVIEQCARVRVLLNAIDAWIFEQPSRAMNKSKRTVSPVVLQRQKLSDSLVRYLSLLGLERKAETITLAGYIESEYGDDETDDKRRAS